VAGYVPAFRFVLEDISHETDEALKARAITALARLALFCLRYAREPRELVARLRGWRQLVGEVKRAPGGMAALVRIMRYIMEVNHAARPEEILALLAAAVEEAKEEIVTAADQLREQGREQDRREIVLDQLSERFGTLPDDAVARVMAAGMDQLRLWTRRVISAPTLDEVFAG